MDRIEGNRAVCLDEDDNIFTLPLSFFPEKPKDGDVFTLSLIRDPAKKAEMHKEITSLFERLKKKGDSTK